MKSKMLYALVLVIGITIGAIGMQFWYAQQIKSVKDDMVETGKTIKEGAAVAADTAGAAFNWVGDKVNKLTSSGVEIPAETPAKQ